MILKKQSFILVIILLLVFQNLAGQEIFQATKNGDLDKIKKMLVKEPGLINFKDERGVSTLHIAAESGQLGIIKFLIKNGLDKDMQDINKMTPLIYASRSGKIDLVKFFVELGANMNQQTQTGRTALHWAGKNNHQHVMEFLFKKGANKEIKDLRGRTPLLATLLKNGDADTFKIFVKYGANLEAKIRRTSVIIQAARNGYSEIVNILLENKVKVDKENNSLFYSSVNNGLFKLFKVFVKMGIDFNLMKKNGWDLLHSAANGGSVEITVIILKKGFDINKQNRFGWTPLHSAAYSGHLQILEKLIDNGAEINKKTFSGKTAYNMAVKNEFKDIAELLKSKGANINKFQLSVDKTSYLGQKIPGKEAELFAVDIVASHRGESNCVAISLDGKEIFWDSYFGKKYGSRILYSGKKKNIWTVPEFAFFSKLIQYNDSTPFFSPKGDKLFFISRRPLNPKDKGEKENIWVIKREKNDWSKPEPVSDLINSKSPHMQFSVSNKDTLFFNSKDGGGLGKSDLYYSKYENGKYLKPINIGAPVNSKFTEFTPYIAPDESYLIFSRVGQSDGIGASDLYLSFYGKNEKWSEPINMRNAVNSRGWETCPVVSPDGKYLFFNRNSDIYWISAKIIEELRKKMK